MALAASFAAVGLRAALEPLLGLSVPLQLLLVAPLITAHLVGLAPALLSLAACAVAGELLFVAPAGRLLPATRDAWAGLGVFLAVGAALSAVVSSRRSQALALVAQRDRLAQAEALSAERERRFQTLFDAGPVTKYVIDPATGQILLANKPAAAQSGYAKEDLELMSAADLLEHPGDIRSLLARATAEHPIEFETVQRTRAGELRGVVIYAQALDLDGKRVVLASVLDVTDRKRMEENLRRADRQKDEFLAMLAHELRNPLAPLTMGLELLQMNAAIDERVRRTIEMAKRQAWQLTSIVNDLLEVARISRGMIALVREPHALQDLIAESVDAARPMAEAKRQTIFCSLPKAPVGVEVDRSRLLQVMGHLLANASKFTPKGGNIWVEVCADAGIAEVRVRDDGVGIHPRDLPGLFTLFAQSDATIDRHAGGLGLGLALVKRLVEMHGGSVRATSEGRGLGSTFRFELPRARLDTDPPGRQKNWRADHQRLLRQEVLVVDDNEDAAATLAELLRIGGQHVLVAYDALSGLELAKQHAPDVALLDIGLPGIDGYELARRLRNTVRHKRVILVAITGYGAASDKERAKAAGFDHHLLKPVRPKDVLELLDTA